MTRRRRSWGESPPSSSCPTAAPRCPGSGRISAAEEQCPGERPCLWPARRSAGRPVTARIQALRSIKGAPAVHWTAGAPLIVTGGESAQRRLPRFWDSAGKGHRPQAPIILQRIYGVQLLHSIYRLYSNGSTGSEAARTKRSRRAESAWRTADARGREKALPQRGGPAAEVSAQAV